MSNTTKGADDALVATIDYDSLAPIEFAFKIGGEEYTLKEATNDGVMRWQNAVMRSLDTAPNGDRIPSDRTNETRLVLLSGCIYPSGSSKNIPAEKIKAWPQRAVSDLFDRAKRMCGEHEDVDTLDNLQKRKLALEERIATLIRSGSDMEGKSGPKS